MLGDTREAIFAEKAAVIKGGDAVFGPLDGLEGAAEQVCAGVGARAHLLGRDFTVERRHRPTSPCARPTRSTRTCAVPSPARYQVVNAGVAVVAADLLLGELERRAVRAALASVVVPGRLADRRRATPAARRRRAQPGGHAGPRRDARRPRSAAPGGRRPGGRCATRTSAACSRALLPLLDAVVCTQASEPRSLTAGGLADVVADAAPPAAGRAGGAAAGSRTSPPPGRWPAPSGTVLVTGSLYLLEDLADVLQGSARAEAMPGRTDAGPAAAVRGGTVASDILARNAWRVEWRSSVRIRWCGS